MNLDGASGNNLSLLQYLGPVLGILKWLVVIQIAGSWCHLEASPSHF